MSQQIENQMTKKGYEKVQGMAVLNDVAVTGTLKAILSTQEAVDIFNDKSCDGWQLYRKNSEFKHEKTQRNNR